MQDFKKILNGWQNFLTKSDVTELMAEERAKICFDCRDKKKNKIISIY